VTDVVLVDRDVRRRPRQSWRAAWSDASHLGGTISSFQFARDAVRDGGWRAITLPTLTCLVMGGAFIGAAFGAAVLSGSADGAQSRGAVLILASVALSQLLTLAQGQKPAKRLFVAAAARVEAPPDGWGRVWVRVPAVVAPDAKRTLEAAFPYVEATYYRHGVEAELEAWYGPVAQGTARPDLPALATATLAGFEHTVGNVVTWHGVAG
jgi:hypothetical protein